jgi:hypothetical protein
MKKIITLGIVLLAALSPAAERVQTTTGEPLTVTGVPVYAIADNGDLNWYFHQGAHNGSALWANGGQAVKVGHGWNEGRAVFKGDPHGNDGIIYRVDSKGDLLWYRHTGRATGAPTWAGPNNVGHGWQDNRLVFGAGEAIVYAIAQNGDLLWFRHSGYKDGSPSWANEGKAAKVGAGWNDVRLAFAGGNGIIYAVDRKGDLFWYHHLGDADGKFSWTNNAQPTKVGNGWNDVAAAFSGGDGLIYALKRDGNLYWYNHSGFRTGAATWAPGTGNRIGTGWGSTVRIF